ncbi:unnamed protein product [Blepharisma stoltei]|uniref:Uncharacterized protein n=1 Tax=Blepharisma stoltei TaxID=1481888 RepID=A0AAU9J6K2_9CILI|nr:unnamed protein product [Blepharisma stoltei]
MEPDVSQRLDFDPSKLEIPGIHKEAIYQLRILDFFSFPAALILSHLEFSFLYQNSYLDLYLQVLQSLARNSQFQEHLPYWMNFMNGFRAEGMNFLDDKASNNEFLSELKVLVMACGVEMQHNRSSIFNSSLILARKFYFTVEIINSNGRSTFMNKVETDMCIPVFLHKERCSIVYPLQKYFKNGIKDIANTPKRKSITLACGDEIDKDDIERSLKLGRNIICKVCGRYLYEQEKIIIEGLIKLPQKRVREERNFQEDSPNILPPESGYLNSPAKTGNNKPKKKQNRLKAFFKRYSCCSIF